MNSGFFLFFGTIAFGFMSEIEHRALAQFFVSSPLTLMIPVGVWILYGIKIIRFNHSELRADRNRFLFNMQFFRAPDQALACLVFFLLQAFPAIAYGMFLMAVAADMSAFENIEIVALVIFLGLVCGTLRMLQLFRNPLRDRKVSAIRRFLDRRFVRPAVQFYIEWLLREFPLTVIAIKVLTGGLLLGICLLYRAEPFDWRLLAMACTFCGLANAIPLFHLVHYEHNDLRWIKNLPATRLQRFTRLLAVASLSIIPECVVMIRNAPSHLAPVPIVLDVLYLLSIGIFFLGLLHVRPAPLEYFTRKGFWYCTGLIILILFKAPLVLIILVNTVTGYLLFYRKYYMLESSG